MIEKVKSVIPSDVIMLDMIDLSTVGAASNLYQQVKPLKEDEFADNVRIVFYHSAPLTRSFADLPPDILISLQKILAYVDIPNFFCLMVSDTDLTNDLSYVSKYAINDVPISFKQI